MSNNSQGRTPFIMEFNRHVDYRMTFNKPLPKGPNTTQPSLVTIAEIYHGPMNTASSNQCQVSDKSLQCYVPFINSNEVWRVLDIKVGDHHLSAYELSNQGRVRRRQDQVLVLLFICNESGLVMCDLGVPSRRHLPVDALVCQLFCMDTLQNQDIANVVVNHRDGNRLNNHAANLEYMLKHIHDAQVQDNQPQDHTVVLDGRLYHHFGARLSYIVRRDSTRRVQ